MVRAIVMMLAHHYRPSAIHQVLTTTAPATNRMPDVEGCCSLLTTSICIATIIMVIIIKITILSNIGRAVGLDGDETT